MAGVLLESLAATDFGKGGYSPDDLDDVTGEPLGHPPRSAGRGPSRHPLSDDPYSVYWLVEHPSSNDDRVSDGSKPTAQVEQVSVGVLAVPLPVSPKLVEEPAFTRPL